MNCQYCGFQNAESASYCRKCASLLIKRAPPEIPQPPCRYCGKPTGERRITKQTTFGSLNQTLCYCYHCQSFQI